MSNAVAARYRPYLPLLVPILVSLIGSGLVMLMALEAYREQQCGLALPWGDAASKRILQDYFPGAWSEAQRLAQISSECVSRLHADVVSSYLCVFGISLAFGIFSLPFTIFIEMKASTAGESEYKRVAYSIAALLLFLLFLFYQFLYSSTIISFGPSPGRRRLAKYAIGFDGEYANIFGYWLSIQAIPVLGALTLWIGCLAIVHVWRATVRGAKVQK
ncbi:hypothetical protein AB4097_18350 [Microvirga sp. 2MCAF35]|uniref:hypothetical protein n=1 Tax=Microvirga sp. 2MCAF35 TaxID=3232987 RepID=UPI003F9D0709